MAAIKYWTVVVVDDEAHVVSEEVELSLREAIGEAERTLREFEGNAEFVYVCDRSREVVREYEWPRAGQQLPAIELTGVRLWACSDCDQYLPHPRAPCDCPNRSGDRYLVSPLGLIPAQQLSTGPLETEVVV